MFPLDVDGTHQAPFIKVSGVMDDHCMRVFHIGLEPVVIVREMGDVEVVFMKDMAESRLVGIFLVVLCVAIFNPVANDFGMAFENKDSDLVAFNVAF